MAPFGNGYNRTKKRYKCQLYKNAKRIKPFVCSYVFISNTIKIAFGDMHSVFGWPKVDQEVDASGDKPNKT